MKQNILFLAGLLLLALPATAAVGNVAKSYTEPNDTAVTLSSTDTVAPTADFILNISELLSDTMPEYTVNPLFLPLVFEKQEVTPYEKLEVEQWNNHRLTYDVDTLLPRNDKWLSLATREAGRVEAARNYVIVNCPYLVKYNLDNLPEIPKQYMIVNDPTKQTITIVERPITPVTELQAKPVKIKRWGRSTLLLLRKIPCIRCEWERMCFSLTQSSVIRHSATGTTRRHYNSRRRFLPTMHPTLTIYRPSSSLRVN